MKPTIYVYVLCLILFTGCDSYLDETQILNEETAETGFTTESHADQSITAIYSDIKMRDGLNGRSAFVLFDMSTKDLMMIREPNKVNNYTFNASTDDLAFSVFWQKMYAIIGRCNSSIEIVPQTAAPVEKVSRYNSEAKVIRAMMYYHLMMAYGTCPMVLETIKPSDKEGMLVGDATREELYTTMISDLEEVVMNVDFPWEKQLDASELGHVGKATAYTLLSYFYLSRGWEDNSTDDFTKAKSAAKQVIDNGGYTLEPVLLDAYYKRFSTESIFELSGSNVARGFGSFTCSWFVPQTPPEGANKDLYSGWYKMAMTQKLNDAFEVNDARRYLMAHKDQGENNYWAPKFLGGDKYGGPVLVIDAVNDDVFGEAAFQCAKGAGAPQNWQERLHPADGVGSNWVLYRLSDVYLLYAEACIKTDDEAEAVTYINKVRERSRNTWTAYLPIGDPEIPTHTAGIPADIPALSGNDLLNALKNERRMELFGEMKRMIDIRRWSLGGDMDLENEVNVVGNWSNKYKWFPKPQDQVDISEGNVKQNDGY